MVDGLAPCLALDGMSFGFIIQGYLSAPTAPLLFRELGGSQSGMILLPRDTVMVRTGTRDAQSCCLTSHTCRAVPTVGNCQVQSASLVEVETH